jgi:exopolysaccharide production protein ExoZ
MVRAGRSDHNTGITRIDLLAVASSTKPVLTIGGAMTQGTPLVRKHQVETVYSIQLLRCIAATLVVLFHTQKAFSESVSAPILPREDYLFAFGAVGVHIFFVISGFVMVLTNAPSGAPFDISEFYKRRFLRIYPTYWLCVLIYVMVHALVGHPYVVTPSTALSALLLSPKWSSLFIGAAWSLSYEIFFYICFGLAMMLSLTRGLIALFIGFAALMLAGHLMEPSSGQLAAITSLLLSEFLAGTAIGWLAIAGRLPMRWGRALTGLGAGLFVAGLVADYTRWTTVATWGIPSAVLVLGIVSWEGAKGASPLVKRLSRLGDSSYVLYLIHALVVAAAVVCCRGLPKSLVPSPPAAALIVALLSIAVAELLHRGIERPMLGLLNPRRRLVPTPAERP